MVSALRIVESMLGSSIPRALVRLAELDKVTGRDTMLCAAAEIQQHALRYGGLGLHYCVDTAAL